MNLAKNIIGSPSEYEQASALAREVGEEMLARLELMTIKPRVIVDAGCGTGEQSMRLHERYPQAEILAVDLSDAMIAYAKHREGRQSSLLSYHHLDAASLPLPDQSADLVFANLLLPWHNEVKRLLQEWRRVLRPEGLLMLSALGPDTLRECPLVSMLPQRVDMHEVGDALLQQGFADPVLDVNYYTMTYASKEKLSRELYESGMVAALPSVDDLAGLAVAEEGRWHLTYEVIFGHAFSPTQSEEVSPSPDGVVRIPLAHLRQRMRKS
jgi:malonyl-CoA O-methyltransferase